MQISAKESLTIETGYKVLNVVDGDGLILENIHSKKVQEFRLYGIDAPEIKKCRKLKEDEAKLHLPGQLLIQLGYMSMKYLKSIAQVGSSCSIAFENSNTTDFYNRRLAYVFIENVSLNEIMVREGFAKPLNDYYCVELQNYQMINIEAKNAKKGLYDIVQKF